MKYGRSRTRALLSASRLRNWEVTCTFAEEEFDRGELEEVLDKLLTKLTPGRATESDFLARFRHLNAYAAVLIGKR